MTKKPRDKLLVLNDDEHRALLALLVDVVSSDATYNKDIMRSIASKVIHAREIHDIGEQHGKESSRQGDDKKPS